MASLPALPDNIMSLIKSIKISFDDDRCFHARDDLVKCRALAAVAECSQLLEDFLQTDSHMRVITSHVQLLDEALDLVRNDSSGVVLSFTNYNSTSLALLLHLVLQNSLFSSSSSQAGIFFTMTKQALGNSKYLQFV